MVWPGVRPTAAAFPAPTKAAQPGCGRAGLLFLATTYSRGTCRPTTIGAAAFHFRVRDGNGWFHRAVVTRGGAGDRDGKAFACSPFPDRGVHGGRAAGEVKQKNQKRDISGVLKCSFGVGGRAL